MQIPSILRTMGVSEWSGPVVLNRGVVTPGVAYQLSCISDIYVMIPNSRKITHMK